MFAGKKDPRREAQDARNSIYQHEFEYRVVAIIGASNLEKELNDLARVGWELVNGDTGGTTLYAYMRRRLTP